MNRILNYLFAYSILFVTIISSFILFYFRTSEYDLLNINNNLKYTSFNDKSENGNSIATLKVDTGKSIQFFYELKKGYEYPFAGFSIDSKKQNTYNDFTHFQNLKINIIASKAKKIPITFNVFCDKFSNTKDDESLISYVYSLDYDPKILSYEIPLDKFEIPTWWLKDKNIMDASSVNCKFEKVKAINIESCALLAQNIPDKITVSELTFISYRKWYWYTLSIGSLIGITILISVYTKRKKTIFVPYQSTPEQIKKGVNPEKLVLEFLAQNYSNSELSMAIIYKETGIPESKIAAAIKSETGLTFKQYLNDFRIAEAKRLLNEHSLSISEIAYRVGYNNVTHFNRVFKSETNFSPGDFRLSK